MPRNIYKLAVQVQDAPNISGVFLSFKELVEEINKEYAAAHNCDRTTFFRNHPALILYFDKMCDLMGWCREHGTMQFADAITACEQKGGVALV